MKHALSTLLAELPCLPVPERATEWPSRQLAALGAAGGWRWNIPPDCGGDGLTAGEMLDVYRQLASVSLVTTFILTQRNAACQRIETSDNSTLRSHWLTALCQGRVFATVGISHLTTSRQYMQTPAVMVQRTAQGTGYLLQGSVPWATAATQAQVLVTGGTLPDGRQILAAVPTDRHGLCVRPPVELMGLSASQTGAVELQQVAVGNDEILHGPVERVMSQRTGGGAGSLATSALAIGAAEGMLRQFAEEAAKRRELNEFLVPLQQEADCLVQRLQAAADPAADPVVAGSESLRQRANQLVLRTAQLWLAATKGAGYVAGHPAERAVRESMFFLVWSCPQPVLDAHLRELSCVRRGDGTESL